MPKRDGILAGAGALALLVALSAALSHYSANQTKEAASQRFDYRVAEAHDAVARRLGAYEEVVRGATALFAASGQVTRRDWWAYVYQLDLDKRSPGIQALAWIPVVAHERIAAHIAGVRAEGFPSYDVFPAGERSQYAPALYLEPFDWRNRRAFGFDLLTEPARRAALLRARDQAMLSATAKITLKQETMQDVQSGFLLCNAVFPAGEVPSTLEGRRLSVIGFVCAVFRMNDLMRDIFGSQSSDVRVEIYDGAIPTAANRLYDSGTSDLKRVAMFNAQQGFSFNGQRWTLRFSSSPAFEAAVDYNASRILLIAGVLVSALLALVVLSSVQNRRKAISVAKVNQELRQLTVELEAAKEAAEAASRAKGDFLANVSHELRTPLALILAPAKQLSTASTPRPDWHEQIKRIERNALLLLGRVNALLDMSKADAGKLGVQWQRVSLGDLVEPIAKDMAVLAAEARCALVWSVDTALDTVVIDPTHIETILLNLLSNAIKFTPAGGRVTLAVNAVGNERFEIDVCDTGIGIAPEKIPLLFERFTQADATITRQYGGTGIGLALVKELTTLMGGDISVKSALGQGTRFVINLPCGELTAEAPADGAPATQSAPLRPELRRAQLASGALALASVPPDRFKARRAGLPTILVADDSADMRQYVGALLADDCNVLTAPDGNAAWDVLAHEAVDVLVSDIMMPGIDGISLAAKVKQDPSLSQVPVILVTARGGADASAYGLNSGADDYLAKPFEPEELRARVRAALRMRTVQLQLRDASREAGMATVAAGVLHNLGNILSGTAVSAALLADQLHRGHGDRLHKIASALRTMVLPESSRALPEYVDQLGVQLQSERDTLRAEIGNLRESIDDAIAVVAAQQNFARLGSAVLERVSATDLLNDAVRLAKFTEGDIERRDGDDCLLVVDRYLTLHILINLLTNARDAMRDLPPGDRRLLLRAERIGDRVELEVRDSGVGIPPEIVPRLFDQGFSTKGKGHGLGLHVSALWAHQLGGVLCCTSAGLGQGASFVLTLPCSSNGHAQADEAAVQAADAEIREMAGGPDEPSN